MYFCIAGKILATFLGIFLWQKNIVSALWPQAFFIGILPIWLEVLCSTLLKVEPSQEKNRLILYLDAVVDSISFLFIPCWWFFMNGGDLIPLLVFIVSGIWRLQNFLRKGLVNGKYFVGVPVTYMGYLWMILIFIPNHLIHNILIISAAYLMNAPFIKIKAQNYESVKN